MRNHMISFAPMDTADLTDGKIISIDETEGDVELKESKKPGGKQEVRV